MGTRLKKGKAKRVQVNFKLDPSTIVEIRRVAQVENTTKTAVVETAVNRLARRVK